jgi:hypothetical protein
MKQFIFLNIVMLTSMNSLAGLDTFDAFVAARREMQFAYHEVASVISEQSVDNYLNRIFSSGSNFRNLRNGVVMDDAWAFMFKEMAAGRDLRPDTFFAARSAGWYNFFCEKAYRLVAMMIDLKERAISLPPKKRYCLELLTQE